jgi:hypothetical protein
MRRCARWGVSLIELITASCLIVVGFFTFFSVLSTGSHQGVQADYHAAANLLAQSYLDDFRSHRFGAPAPPQWSQRLERPVRMISKGKKMELVFHKEIEYETGAFVGIASGDQDRVTLTIRWENASGSDTAGTFTGFPEENNRIRVEVPVWR